MGDQIFGGTKAMEKLVLENKKLSFSHFSHDHPLRLTNSPPKDNNFCSACKLKITSSGNEAYYTCKTCSFFLHQVCYNMPRKTRHPAHQAHRLTLQTTPSVSQEVSFKCKACGDHINGGFYYGCTECGICYHILCSALPHSILVTSHPHELKLAFSPPYNFSCDICSKPSYNGWLYRCRLCEFDTHLICAISNRTSKSVDGQHRLMPFSNSSNQHISTNSSPADNNSKVEELMRLVTQGLLEKNAVSSWDLRLNSPQDNPNITRTQVVTGVFHQTDSKLGINSPIPGIKFLHQSPLLTSVSEDWSTTPSTQFSAACFSIDLAKSYSSYGTTNQARTEANNSNSNIRATKVDIKPEVQGEKISKQEKELSYGNGTTGRIYSFNMGRDERLKEAFLVRNDTLAKEEAYIGQKVKKNKSKATSDIVSSPTSKHLFI
ncbi:C1-like [Parasponia andersonii]|uniref:C1-like n=1 Tax=Parasponia andersonii TaxID=3476 RepID=A0A2P5B6R5_PARAD|nr:C1-like [Parasponia andersonii]